MSIKIKFKRKFRRLREGHYTYDIIGYFIILFLLIFTIFLFDNLLLPKIKLNKGRIITIDYKSNYHELGYKASFLGHNLTSKVKVSGQVNTKKLGKYKIIYKVQYGHIIKKTTRYVIVRDKTSPKIELDSSLYYVCPKKKFKPKKVKVVDNYDGDISNKLKYKLKKNYIIYYVKDSSGNKTKIKKNIIYKDKYSPKISVIGDEYVYLYVGDTYDDLGATITDNCDKKLKINTTSNVDTTKPGMYKITYKSKDKSNNKATIDRHVIVSEKNKDGLIYLTFDDGPREETTNVILDILKEENVPATFFVTNQGPDYLIKREHDEGHSIGLHSSSHNYSIIYSSIDNFYNDLNEVSSRVERITGEKSKIIRFPGGSSNTISRKFSPGIMSKLTEDVVKKGYKYYDWNINSQDAEMGPHTKDEIKNNVLNRLRKDKPNIVLMHDVKPYTRDALKGLIDTCKERGYQFDKLTINNDMVRQRVNN